MNGHNWSVKFVHPQNPKLVDRTNILRVATTDPSDHCVYLSQALQGEFLRHVFVHELGHCTMVSFGLIEEIHRVVYPEYWIEAEEWVCNFIADFGMMIFDTAYSMLGDYNRAFMFVPSEIEKAIRNKDWRWLYESG